VLPIDEFARYYSDGRVAADHPEGTAQLWERLALTRARPVLGDADFQRAVMTAVTAGAYEIPWRASNVDEVLAMRQRLEASRGDRDVKRGPGGLMDLELLVGLLKTRYGLTLPATELTNTCAALEALAGSGRLDVREARDLREAFDFLLRVQGRLRIVHNRSIDEVPESSEEVEKLARRLGYEANTGAAGGHFLSDLRRHTGRMRELFLEILERERKS
jgi:glutamate-ammonia-ligase adenylyltransferase